MAIKLTTEEYKQKLLNKNIKVKLLEEYTGSNNKLLHKCTCGNEWKASPKEVIKGTLCPHNKSTSHELYLEKLKLKNIEVTPLEKYTKTRIKILHKCICGNTWNIEPMYVLQGVHCGCKLKSNGVARDFYKDKKTILYYIEINGIYKIGITSRSIKERYLYEDVKYSIIKYKSFINGTDAYDLEKDIKKINSNKKYKGPKIFSKTGNTELFFEDINPQF